jgi:hypothetical protein
MRRIDHEDVSVGCFSGRLDLTSRHSCLNENFELTHARASGGIAMRSRSRICDEDGSGSIMTHTNVA